MALLNEQERAFAALIMQEFGGDAVIKKDALNAAANVTEIELDDNGGGDLFVRVILDEYEDDDQIPDEGPWPHGN